MQKVPEANASKASSRKGSRRVGKVLLIVLGVVLAALLVIIGLLLYWSPGKAAPILNEDGSVRAGSISEKLHIEINGVQQGMFIRGESIDNPVLLFVHGGPGMPGYFLARDYDHPLEALFTVCWWDQRGAGLSYEPGMDAKEITIENIVADAIGVTNYLRERFGQDKIYLMGHSWGTNPGIRTAQAAPELYHAYIGMSQETFQPESEQIAYNYMIEQYRQQGNDRMVQKMESAMAKGSYNGSGLRDQAMHELGVGTMRDMDSVITGAFFPSWTCREYTLGEKINLWRAKFSGINKVLNEAKDADLRELVTNLEMPVYIWGGRYDYTVNADMAKAYLLQLEAPVKGFYTFENSAHSPLFEEPEKAGQILREDVLTATTGLADAR